MGSWGSRADLLRQTLQLLEENPEAVAGGTAPGPKDKDKKERKDPKDKKKKTEEQECKSCINNASGKILEAKTWEQKLKDNGTPLEHDQSMRVSFLRHIFL